MTGGRRGPLPAGEGVAGSRRVGGRWVAQAKGQKRPTFGGVSFRSRAEANYAAFLTLLGVAYQYEPTRFTFTKARGARNRTFMPDFYLPKSREYHEVKGYLDHDSRVRLNHMRREYPEVKLLVIDERFFKDVERKRLCRAIPGWRCRHTDGGGSEWPRK